MVFIEVDLLADNRAVGVAIRDNFKHGSLRGSARGDEYTKPVFLGPFHDEFRGFPAIRLDQPRPMAITETNRLFIIKQLEARGLQGIAVVTGGKESTGYTEFRSFHPALPGAGRGLRFSPQAALRPGMAGDRWREGGRSKVERACTRPARTGKLPPGWLAAAVGAPLVGALACKASG